MELSTAKEVIKQENSYSNFSDKNHSLSFQNLNQSIESQHHIMKIIFNLIMNKY